MKGKKIVPGLAAGFATAVLVWGIAQFTKVVIPGEVAAALTGLLTIAISLLTPDELEGE